MRPTTQVERPYHVYVVEDDAAVRDTLSKYLGHQGVFVTPMAGAEEMLLRLRRYRPDLIVMDANLPKRSGLDACRKLRADGDEIPIIFLSSHGDEIDRVLGLEMGADDYLIKPFSARELLARARAILRRAARAPGVPRAEMAPVNIGECVFDLSRRTLRRDNDERMLGDVEYALLSELTINAGIPLSRERLLATSHSRADDVSVRAVDTGVSRLRKLVEPNPMIPRFIQTVRRHGYVFVRDAGLVTKG
jgi:two-component system phosphate regulon response regulator OmpR